MESGRHLDQGAHAACHVTSPHRRLHDSRQELQRRRLAGTVRSDDAKRLTLREAASELGLVKVEDFDRWVRPEDMLGPTSA